MCYMWSWQTVVEISPRKNEIFKCVNEQLLMVLNKGQIRIFTCSNSSPRLSGKRIKVLFDKFPRLTHTPGHRFDFQLRFVYMKIFWNYSCTQPTQFQSHFEVSHYSGIRKLLRHLNSFKDQNYLFLFGYKSVGIR